MARLWGKRRETWRDLTALGPTPRISEVEHRFPKPGVAGSNSAEGANPGFPLYSLVDALPGPSESSWRSS